MCTNVCVSESICVSCPFSLALLKKSVCLFGPILICLFFYLILFLMPLKSKKGCGFGW